jgi:hypothetical protein
MNENSNWALTPATKKDLKILKLLTKEVFVSIKNIGTIGVREVRNKEATLSKQLFKNRFTNKFF